MARPARLDVNALSVAELDEVVRSPTQAQERALRVELGDDGVRRARELVVRSATRAEGAVRGNVVVLHGIMGAELSTMSNGGGMSKLWLKLPSILKGGLTRLRLAEDGCSPADPRWTTLPTAILKRYYVELLLALHREWRVEPFWYDWRRALTTAADDLDAHIQRSFGDEPVHLVAHSMGGLVARTFVARHPERWERMAGDDGRSGGRLVMLGTPNLGSYAVPQIIVGLESIVRKLAALDQRHDRRTLLGIFNTFPGTLQMMPSPTRRPDAEPFYDAATWGDAGVSQAHLDAARRQHELLQPVVDPARMTYVAGNGVPTLAGVDPAQVRDKDAYDVTRAGDGRVPHELGLLEGVPTFFVDADHGGLTKYPAVLAALTALLTTGVSDELPAEPSVQRGAEDPAALRAEYEREQDAEVQAVAELVDSARGGRRGAEARVAPADQHLVEDAAVRGVLAPAQTTRAPSAGGVPVPEIRIRLVNAAIEAVHEHPDAGTPDVIAVGHYRDVAPQAAERALGSAISRPSQATGSNGGPGAAAVADGACDGGILTALTLRGTLRGGLGEPFLLPDPRDRSRLIAVAGMGDPGRFGVAELTVLVRELSWALGRLGREHLATVLIGAGNGNLSIDDAVTGWIRGLRRGLVGEDAAIRALTFAEEDPRRIREAHRALSEAVAREHAEGHMRIDYAFAGDLDAIDEAAVARATAAAISDYAASGQSGDDRDAAPTRIVLTLEGDTYRFGAITASAAVPERSIPIDPALVGEANDELAAEGDPAMQLERGQFLRQIVFPGDLESELSGHAPLVMMLDGTTARVHWEMVGQSGFEPAPDADGDAVLDGFLGTSRGFTRQLRTQFAPPPEPPPPPRRVLRVLVVADPAADMPLAGAQEEGHDVADLFESFGAAHPGGGNTVEVRRLFGPLEATRTNVLRELTQRSYDVLHFAGHCTYVEGRPERSGWIFSNGALIATNELSRVDRVPRFVFSNACESGHHRRRRPRRLQRPGAELRDGVLRPRGVEPRVHRVAGERHRGAGVRGDALPPAARPARRRERRRAPPAGAAARRHARGAAGDRGARLRGADVGRLPALRQPALPALRGDALT